MKHNIEDFAPSNDGKFSPLLYRHLKMLDKKYGADCVRVFQTGSVPNYKVRSETMRMNELIISCRGDQNEGVSGRKVRSIVQGERGPSGSTFHYSPLFNLLDITDKFFDEYKRIGRCVWDARHSMGMIGDENRYTVKGKTRTCNWCGAKHRQRIKIVQYEEETWVPVLPRGAK